MRPLFSIAIVFVFVFGLFAAANAQISFVEPLQSWVAPGSYDGAYGVAVADFNRDKKPDVAFLQITSGVYYVSVMLGNGDGTFAAPVNVFTFSINYFSWGILARDFNGDGKMDIAFTARQLKEIVILPGVGDGTFGTPIITPTTLAADYMQTGDVNGDGKLDLVVVDTSNNMMSVLIGKGDGTFQGEVDYTLGGTNPQDLAVADVSRDGHPDIVVGDYDSGTINILLNDGMGKFSPVSDSPFSVGMQVIGLEVADFNGDGKADIATAGYGNCSPGPSTIRVSLGNGDGTFQAPLKEQCVSGLAPGRHYSDNQAIDLNGDGKFDIVFGDYNNEIDVGLGNGDGTFTMAVYVASQGQAGPGTSYVDGNAAQDIAVADFNGDGMLDLLTTEWATNTRKGGISLLPAVHPGVFASPHVFQSGFSGGGFHSIAVGDFNGDAKLDAAELSGEGNGGGAFILLGKGDGTFGPAAATPACNCSGEFYDWLDMASFRANGVLDLLILGTGGVQGGPGPRVIVQYGNGDGTFGGESQVYAVNSNDPYFFPVGAVIGDLNGDHRPDIVVLSLDVANGDRVYVFLNNGNGGFGNPQIINLGAVVGGSNDKAVAIGDFNGDGKPDLVIHTVDPGNTEHIWFLVGHGDGTLASPVDRGSYGGATLGISRYAAVDLNGDGRLDLVGLGFAYGVFVSLGDGDGTFQTSHVYSADQGYLTDMAVADLDGDGKPDVAVVGRCCGGSTGPQGLAVLRNNGDGTLAAALHPSIGETNPSGLAVGDLNGDSWPDFVVMMGSSSNQMSIAAVPVENKSAQASVSPTSLRFANQVIGTTSVAKTVTLSNTGTVALSISTIAASGDFAISTNTCSATLAVGKKCKVKVTFTPTDAGSRTGTLTFSDNAANTPQTAALSGTGVQPATLTPASATFAKRKVGTTSTAKMFTLTNYQSVALSSIAISTTGDFAMSATTCGTSLAAKGKCKISVTFTPTATGTRTGQLIVHDSANNSPQMSNLTGTGY